jgi:Rrf2 family protein
MVRISRKLSYAVVALAYMAERPGERVSARRIAAEEGLPAALLTRLLKLLHGGGLLVSSRGSGGGYQLAVDLASVSVLDLVRILGGRRDDELPDDPALAPPLVALRGRLNEMLRSVRVGDLTTPGHRVDVPIERIGVKHKTKPPVTTSVAAAQLD